MKKHACACYTFHILRSSLVSQCFWNRKLRLTTWNAVEGCSVAWQLRCGGWSGWRCAHLLCSASLRTSMGSFSDCRCGTAFAGCLAPSGGATLTPPSYSFKYSVLLNFVRIYGTVQQNVTLTWLSRPCGTNAVPQYIITGVFFSMFVQCALASSCRIFLRVLLIPISVATWERTWIN